MIKIGKKFVAGVGLVSAMFAVLAMVAVATPHVALAASAKSEICQGIGEASGSCNAGRSGSIDTLMRNVINIISIVGGFTAVIMIVIAGIKFITAQGEASGIASARSSLMYALIGLVVVALAQVIVHFILGKAT